MKTRMLGTLAVSEIGFGTMSFTGIFGEAPDRAEIHQRHSRRA